MDRTRSKAECCFGAGSRPTMEPRRDTAPLTRGMERELAHSRTVLGAGWVEGHRREDFEKEMDSPRAGERSHRRLKKIDICSRVLPRQRHLYTPTQRAHGDHGRPLPALVVIQGKRGGYLKRSPAVIPFERRSWQQGPPGRRDKEEKGRCSRDPPCAIRDELR